ncbi:uncharacterized protein BXIN_0920 [Babesia sp. Xinjiang]|uniref:uncharacterized protein n=1 Tax=Babesia sp. Xinjiang TaxID=462227 RepID=UPI000A236932|nr:uncharacterized protein BXIN_0920 [Babesia sp. Xinjiang]ORM42069.1 hypothetical protein BXIN_0920 [Babesia sp. Xinjiang]
MSTAQDKIDEPWLGLCTPFMCLNRKERRPEDQQERESLGVVMTGGDTDYDSLERLSSVCDGLFRLDKQVLQLKSREAFIRSCLTDAEQFNIKIIAKGIRDTDALAAQISKEQYIDKESLIDILSGLKLSQESKLEDSIKAITYHLINKLTAIQHDLEDSLRDYDAFHNSTIDEYENMRKRFFDLTLSRSKGKEGIDFSVSKEDFMFIANSKNKTMIDIIFSLLDDDGKGVIDWGAFELNSGRILKDAKGLVKTSQKAATKTAMDGNATNKQLE